MCSLIGLFFPAEKRLDTHSMMTIILCSIDTDSSLAQCDFCFFRLSQGVLIDNTRWRVTGNFRETGNHTAKVMNQNQFRLL